MHGERQFSFKSMILCPLVWIGLIMTIFSLKYEKTSEVFGLFSEPTVYRNLAIGALIYAFIFDRQYTEGHERIDFVETLYMVVIDMAIIWAVWFISLFLIVNYMLGGEAYRDTLTNKYKDAGWVGDKQDREDTGDDKLSKQLGEMLERADIKEGTRYKVTPNEDGSFTVEIIKE